MLRLLALAVHGANLPDLQEVQKPGVHKRAELQRAYPKAELEAHAVDFGGRRVFPVRAVTEAGVFALQKGEEERSFFG